jgi:hypothetical protein
MRPQGFGQMGVSLEDLGWNDMGHVPQAQPAFPQHQEELPEHVPSSIAALTPAPRPQVEAVPEEYAPPPVVEQQRAIEATFAEPAKAEKAEAPKPQTAAILPLPPRERKPVGSKGKAAFTLRLDPERHLKLRLACAVTHRSAQQIVTGALDEFLASLPELDAMASQVPSKGKRN